MKPDIWYIVTKASDDGTFEVGDRIKRMSDGDILSKTAGGWLDAAYVEKATKGMEYVVDERWLAAQKKRLNEELNQLNELEK